jgi:hypothetical protein
MKNQWVRDGGSGSGLTAEQSGLKSNTFLLKKKVWTKRISDADRE